MKTILIISLVILSTFIIYFIILGHNSKSKEAPRLIDDHLSKCPDTPNCYNTEIQKHIGHYISPIKLSTTVNDSLNIIKDIVCNMDGIIQIENEKYFSAIFISSVFGFVDDLEIRMDTEKKLIHIRSSSRVGRSDLGVNKKRILLIKRLYKNKVTETEQKQIQ